MEFWFPLHLQMCPWVGELVMADWNANAIHLPRLKATHLTKGRDHQGEDPFARTFIQGQCKNLSNHQAIVVNSVRWKCSSKMSLQLSLQKDKSVRDRMATQGAAAGWIGHGAWERSPGCNLCELLDFFTQALGQSADPAVNLHSHKLCGQKHAITK